MTAGYSPRSPGPALIFYGRDLLAPREGRSSFIHIGCAKTHDLVYRFHAGPVDTGQARDLLTAFEEPVHLLPPTEWVSKSKAWAMDLCVPDEPRTHERSKGRPYDIERFGGWDRFGAYWQKTSLNAGGYHSNMDTVMGRYVQSGDYTVFRHWAPRGRAMVEYTPWSPEGFHFAPGTVEHTKKANGGFPMIPVNTLIGETAFMPAEYELYRYFVARDRHWPNYKEEEYVEPCEGYMERWFGRPDSGHFGIFPVTETYLLTGDEDARDSIIALCDWAVHFGHYIPKDQGGTGFPYFWEPDNPTGWHGKGQLHPRRLIPFAYGYRVTGRRDIYELGADLVSYDDNPYHGAYQSWYTLVQQPKTDTTPPAAVKDLSVKPLGNGAVETSFTAPGDDGATGTAAEYQLKWSTMPLQSCFSQLPRLPSTAVLAVAASMNPAPRLTRGRGDPMLGAGIGPVLSRPRHNAAGAGRGIFQLRQSRGVFPMFHTAKSPATWLAAVACLIGSLVYGPAGRRSLAAESPPDALARQILATTDTHGGLVVHLGCGDGQLTAALHAGPSYLVQGLDADPQNVAAARRHVQGLGLYGPVSVGRLDGERLPYVDNLANLLVAEDPGDVAVEEIVRVLVPGGKARIKQDGEWKTLVKRWPERIDQWTHYLHGPDNNAVAADSVAGEPRSVQWISEPRFGRSHEELASVSTTVTAGGRLFYIADEAPFASIRFPGQWRLVARDAFSGVPLWKREIPLWTDHLRHFRSGPVHLQRRLVAVGHWVYVTLGLDAPVSALDAATGETETVYAETEFTEEILVDDGVLYLVVGTSETERTGGGLHRRGEPEPTDFRYIAAVDAESGRRLWKHEFGGGEFLLPLTLAVCDGSVYYQSTRGVGRLDAASGREIWRTPRPTPARRMGFSAPTLVATEKVVLCADREPSPGKPESAPATEGPVAWGVHGWNEPGFARRGLSKLRAYSVENGDELWSADCSEQYNAPTDLFVVDGVAWVGCDFRGHDIETGEVVRQLRWKGAPVAMPHHRCYRNKATEKHILTGRSGIEMVSFEDGWLGNNSWIRGTCQYGVMPANGLVYAPPNACACYNKVKVLGFTAAAPQRQETPPSDAARLEKGPAYAAAAAEAPAGAWPMYRHDNARSGATTVTVPAELEPKWSFELGGRLTQPVVAGGRAFVAATDAHTVHALDAGDGRRLWSFTAGARIDSSPTFYGGTLLFGSADGWVYCVSAEDGQLVWRFRAAPQARLVGAFDQLESAWPVHGSVLVQDDVAYVVAGRNSYLDGGLVLYRLDPQTGEELSRTEVCHLDPETGRQIGREPSGGFDMEGVRSDLLSGDGESVFMKHFRFDREGRQMDMTVPHLFSVDGFLGEEWFVRSYWIFGTHVGAGWGGWANAASSSPAGRILSFTGDAMFGYGRTTISSGATGHRADTYHLWRRPRQSADAEPGAKKPAKRRKGLAPPVWSDKESLTVRAMVLTPGTLFVAGPPDLGQKTTGLLALENPDEALAAFRGERGVLLRAVSTEDGSTQAEHPLGALPVFDGMSAAEGKLFLALRDGTVVCWGGR